jgi:hypothetical protein
MAETIKSVLFLDYDSVRRALEADDRQAAERIGLRVPAWIAAIEAGTLLGDAENPVRRRILMRRCYADPTLLGSDRSVFLTNGFQVIDCPTAEGRDRNAAPIHMVLDTIDALDHPAGYEEFVLLSADTDLSPILIRLRAHNRTTAIYANPVTADSYKAIADAMIDEDELVEIILSDERPRGVADAPPAPPPAERSEIESLARKVSTATNVPLFAPRTYAELFRQLVEEIAEKGYHHQTTAESVASRMASGGRNITRRQVVFVVKGLALKGHVFSTNDTPERLAEVFREQVLYLCESAQMNLSDREKHILASWIVGRVQPAGAGAAAETEIAAARAAETPAPAQAAKPAPKPVDDQAARNARRGKQPVRPTPPAPAPKAEAAPIVTPPPKPVVEPPKPAPAPPKQAEPAPPPKQAEPVATPPPPAKPEEPKAPVRTILTPKTGAGATAAKPATPTKPLIPARTLTAPQKPAATPPAAPAASRPASAPTAKPATPARPVQPPRATPAPVVMSEEDDEKDAVESSILAAIAQAVDVLVEDSGSRPKPQSTGAAATPAEAAAAPPAEERPAPAPAPQEEEIPEGDDIGDEIQRIIASYNRNREK